LCRLGSSGLARPECILKAARGRAFGRAFRRQIEPGDVEALFARASEHARMEQVAPMPGLAPTGTAQPDEQDRERD